MVDKTRILIVDTPNLVRDGLAALLNSAADLQVIGTLGKISTIRNASLPAPPELVILDVDIPDYRGAETIKAIGTRWPGVKVMILTFQQGAQAMETALRAGVGAYLLKSDTRKELHDALQHLAAGKRYITPSFAAPVPGATAQKLPAARQPLDGLSNRERDVLRRIAQGQRTREIAHELSLSHKTIEKYRSNLMRKLGLRSATAVAAYAITNGYLEP
jgi:DNA-binding NarL/FixJ family response regulator